MDEIRAHQLTALRELVEVSHRSPYYRGVLEGLGKPAWRFELEDLKSLPFLTKQVLSEQGERLRIAGARGVYENHSGGSTGIPVRFWQDWRYQVHMSAATRRSNELAGAFPGARVAKLWGAPQDRRQIEGPAGRARLWLLNMRYCDSFDMGPRRMEQYHRSMQEFQPDLIQAYASSIWLLARFLKARGLRPSYPRVSIITAAEKLHAHMRGDIEEVFQAPVFDRYGSREVSAMAAECDAHNGLHIQMPGYIVETLDPRTLAPVEDQPGEIVITVLNNHAMPFLRYRIGDMGVLTRTRCACGRSFERLLEISGRTSDNFLMRDGRIVHGEYFTHVFYGRQGIAQFQFEQHSLDDFTLRIVPGARYSPDTGRAIEREVREFIGEGPRLRLEVREQIPVAASGKYRFTISHVKMNELVGGERG